MPNQYGFSLQAQREISSLNATIQHFVHDTTGAEHFHIQADFPENVFLVALRTVPTDSTGVAHVLEHTVLCGSEKYPVRDPFFMMSRRSLNSFMNAFTSSDWTAYPFASEHKKDFDHLLDIYLDAVFFPNIDKRDFHQEGHRLVIDDEGKLSHQGVVYNEMIGAMQPVTTKLWDHLCRALFPTSTYHFNSGGDPAQIAQLSYEQVKDFYETHYHPSNAVFMTFGDRSVDELHEKFQSQALARFTPSSKKIEIKPEIRSSSITRVATSYPSSDSDAKSHVVNAWLIPQSNEPEGFLTAHLLSDLLLDHSGSPLRHLLETTDIAQAPSALCGVEDSMRDGVFVFGLEGVELGKEAQAQAFLDEAVNSVIERGFSVDEIESALHQLELMQREITGDGMPFGLQLMLQGLGAAIHRRDVMAMLDIEPVLASLREKALQPGWLIEQFKNWTINNSHKVELVLAPDEQMAERAQKQVDDNLSLIAESLSEADKDKIRQQNEALAQRQAEVDDTSCLPTMTPSDVSAQAHKISPTKADAGCAFYQVGSNGIAYRYGVRALKPLDESLLPIMPLYAGVLAEVGCGDDDYLTMQAKQNASVGALSASIQYRADPANRKQFGMMFSFGGKALSRNVSQLESLLSGYQKGVRFDEHQRLQEMITQAKLRREQSITGSGHVLAMTAASAAFSPVAALSHEWNGVKALANLRELEAQANDDPASLEAKLKTIHHIVHQQSQQVLAIDDQNGTTDLEQDGADFVWQSGNTLNLAKRTAYTTDTTVNFCARAYAACDMTHADAGALTVLAQVLKNGFLHSAVREQGGAYGGGASYDNANGVFRFYSYRDPRLTDTYADFSQAVEWVQSDAPTQAMVDEGILSVISSLDKPMSPSGEAKIAYFNEQFGRTSAQQTLYRQALLSCTVADVQRVAKQYLNDDYRDVVICSQQNVPEDFNAEEI